MINTKRHWIGVAGALAFLVPTASTAWHTSGHNSLARAAVARLPGSVPEYFRQGADVVGHVAEDPDVWKHDAAPQLREAENPEHFLDVEDLGGRGLAPQRWDFVETLVRRGLAPQRVGVLPYAIVEGTQKLTVAFAEHRRWPGDEAIRWKTLIYAGQLAHYAGDLAQPLHTTVHYDGRRLPDGSSPRTGIHFLADALFDLVPFDAEAAVADVRPAAPRGDLLQAVMTRFWSSHGQVDRVYDLETAMRAVDDGGESTPRLAAFARERFRDGTEFLAGLLLRAWEDSAKIELAAWHDRGGEGAAQGQAGDADPQARELAQRTTGAMGGREAFDGIRLLHFTWQVERGDEIVAEREHWWDRATGDYRVDLHIGSGAPAVVLLNLRTREGRAFAQGSRLAGEEEEALVERAYGAYINDSYWLLMPWKWLEPGVRLEWQGERAVDGRTYEVAVLSFVSGTGLTSGDRYWAWVDPATGLMDRWQYVLQQEDGSPGDQPPTTWIWSDWRPSGGVLFARERRLLDGDAPAAIHFPVVEAIPEPSSRQLAILHEPAPADPSP
ncbi:MAG: hypothetical protein ACRD2Z_07625 [Thermoanaerobaculia bacterium]